MRRTIESQYPPHKVAVLRATPQACRARSEQIGPATAEITAAQLDDRVVDRRHAARSLLRLGDRYGEQRLEAACRRALCFGDTDVATVRRILHKGLEHEPLPEQAVECESPRYAFARPGSEIFGG